MTEIVDLEPDDERDQVLNQKRVDITRHVYGHATKIVERLDADMTAR